MDRDKLPTLLQTSASGTAEETNKRYHYLLSQGVTALSLDLDIPTRKGYDSDHLSSEGKVGKAGVAIDSLHDMDILFHGIELEKISISMNINATGFILLAFYVALAKKQGADLLKLTGGIQNDILKEYVTRRSYIYPPKASMRIVTDILEWCSKEVPQWNTLSMSGYNIAQDFIQDEIASGACQVKKKIESGEKIIVGVNKFQSEKEELSPDLPIDDSIRSWQTEKLGLLKKQRDPAKVDNLLQALNDAAASDENIMPSVIEAVENYCTLGEIADTLREIYGEHK